MALACMQSADPGRAGTAARELAPHLFVATADAGGGSAAALELEAPWTARTELEPTGMIPAVRHFYGMHYVIDRRLGTIQVLDPVSFRTLRTLSFGEGSDPQDIRVVEPRTAYVTFYNSARVLKLDPTTGDILGGIDLGTFADEDGSPELSMMALFRNLLFVQVQRIDRAESGNPVPPSYLAVVDVDKDVLVDVDPEAPGVQGVRLQGTGPATRMHVDPRARRLFVLVPGPMFDQSGGIEEIDLDTLRSRGLIMTEEQGIGDLGPFVMISPNEGYAVGHTDLTISSHLFRFARGLGRTSEELYVTLDLIQSLVHDPIGGFLYFPDSGRIPSGIHVFDARTDERLTATPVSTGRIPRDQILARPSTPGEASDLRLWRADPATGALSFSFRPACGAADHNLVWGRLEDLRRYAYSGQACGIGNDGTYELPDPGDGGLFFLVVGTDGASSEGSYGADGGGGDRPEDASDPVCQFAQDLTFACDTL